MSDERIEVEIRLNGTKENPYLKLGLRQNPFPAIPDANPAFAGANRIIADLAAEPIRNADDLRQRMAGCAPEFVEECANRFVPGEMIKFMISFPAP